MNKEWRPKNWGNLYTGDEKIACERGASAMLAARDKWWIDWIEAHSVLDRNGDVIISESAWQSLKQSLEVKE